MGASDDELRRKYGLGPSVPIQRELPSTYELGKNRWFLKKVGESFGLQEFMLKSWKGVILAVIVVPPTVFGVVDWWTPRIQATADLIAPYLQGLELPAIEPEQRIVQFSPTLELPRPTDPREPFLSLGSVLTSAYRVPTSGLGTLFEVWRIVRTDHIGFASLRHYPSLGTRWSSPGHQVVMTASGVMQALMELTPHGKSLQAMRGMSIVRMELPPGVVPRRIDRAALPSGWDSRPWGASSTEIGDAWLQDRTALALAVPSVIDPASEIVLLNPQHPDFSRVRIAAHEPLSESVDFSV